MAKLHKQNDGSVPVTEMKEGELGAVVSGWPKFVQIGQIIQKIDGVYIRIGCKQMPPFEFSPHARVRILQPGELIEV